LAITEADVNDALSAQLSALEHARDMTALCMEGKGSEEKRRAAMKALEAADAFVLEVRRGMVLQAAKILGATVKRGRST
jgi:hypothetical protein